PDVSPFFHRALRVKVMGHDATCHTGRRSCFYRTVGLIDGKGTLANDGSKPLFDTQETYRKPHEPSI
ncbi:MAG: hypothetical protein E5Y58_30110, partial [Mesorhizobium sp.]